MGNRQKWYTNQMTANHLTKNRQSIFWILVLLFSMFIPITNTPKSQTHRMILTNTSQTHCWFSWVILNRCEYHLHLKSIVIDSFLIFMTSPDNSWHVKDTERVAVDLSNFRNCGDSIGQVSSNRSGNPPTYPPTQFCLLIAWFCIF